MTIDNMYGEKMCNKNVTINKTSTDSLREKIWKAEIELVRKYTLWNGVKDNFLFEIINAYNLAPQFRRQISHFKTENIFLAKVLRF